MNLEEMKRRQKRSLKLRLLRISTRKSTLADRILQATDMTVKWIRPTIRLNDLERERGLHCSMPSN